MLFYRERKTYRNIVVIGGGLVILDVAEYLQEKGCNITVVEMRDAVGINLGDMRKIAVNMAIAQSGIKTVTDNC